MKIVTVQFDFENSKNYERMLSVFRLSVEKNIPGAEFVEIKIEAPDISSGLPWYMYANSEKLRIWRDYLETVNDNVIFCDCDMMALSDPFGVFSQDFDVAITKRTSPSRFPYNGGVVFAKPTAEAVQFFREWSEINDRMFSDEDLYRPYMRKYAGMNQAALGYLLENGHSGTLIELPCLKYNAVGRDIEKAGQQTCFVHVKDLFRKMVLAGRPVIEKYRFAMDKWYYYNNEIQRLRKIKIAAIYYDRNGAYKDLLSAFRLSCLDQMPKADLDIVDIGPPEHCDRIKTIAYCFLASAEYALRSEVPVVIADIDLLFLRPIVDVFDSSFDIGITVRRVLPYNTGLWFYVPNERSRLFVSEWIENTKALIDNYEGSKAYIQKYGGIDQASLAMTIAENETARVKEFDCVEWNSCQDEWEKINTSTRVVHIKSRMRKYCNEEMKTPPQYEWIVNKWRDYVNTGKLSEMDQIAKDTAQERRARRVHRRHELNLQKNKAVSQ